jgi:hypothetical protein
MTKKEHHGAKIEVTKDGPYVVSGGVPLGEQWIETNDEPDDSVPMRPVPPIGFFATDRMPHELRLSRKGKL